MRNIYLVILGLFIFIPILLNLVNAYTLSSCGTINSSGEYYLAGNISASGSCIFVNSSDVIIDGNGYGIYGDGSGVGVEINDGMLNITIKNITIYNFSTSVLFKNTTTYIYDSNIESVKSKQTSILSTPVYKLHIKNSHVGILTNYDPSQAFNSFEILIYNSTVDEILANGDHHFRHLNMTVINSVIGIIKTMGDLTSGGYNFQSCGYPDSSSIYGGKPVIFINSTIYGIESNTQNDFEYECYVLFDNSNIYGNITANYKFFFLRSTLELRNSYMNGSFIAKDVWSPFYSEKNSNRYLLINNSVIESSVAFDLHNTYSTYPDRGASIYILNSIIKTSGNNYADLWRIRIYNSTLSGNYFYFKRGSGNEIYNTTFEVSKDVVMDMSTQSILRNINVNCSSGNCLFINTTSTSVDKNSIACSLSSNGSIYVSDMYPFIAEFYKTDCSSFSCGHSYENYAQDINLTQDGFILGYFDKTPCIYIGNDVSGNVNIYGKVFVGFNNLFAIINNSIEDTYFITLNDSGTYPLVKIYGPSKISVTSYDNMFDVDVYSENIKVDIFNSKLHKIYSSNSVYTYDDINITNSTITTIDGYFKYVDMNITNSIVTNFQSSVSNGFYKSTIRINKSVINTIKPLADYVFSISNMYVYNSTIETFDTSTKTQPFYNGHVYFYDNSYVNNIYLGTGIGSFNGGSMEIYNSTVNYIFFDAYSNGLNGFTLKIDGSKIVGTQQYCLYEEGISSSHTINIYNTEIYNCPDGLYFTGTATVNFINNTIRNTDNAITFSSTKSSTVYNNLFNVSNSFITFTGTINTHVFNTTKMNGTNIVGGPYVGGNYWGCTNVSCFSDTCSDSDKDGICDDIFSLSDTNKDYLPLAVYISNLPPVINDVKFKIIYANYLPNVSMYVNATDPEGELDYLEYLGLVTNTSINGRFEFIIGHKSNISGLLKVNDTYGNSISKNISFVLVNNSYVPKAGYEATTYSQILIKNDTLKNIGEVPFNYEVIHDGLGGTFIQGGTFTGILNPGETAVLYSEIQGDWINESVSKTKNDNIITITEVLTSEFNFTNVTALVDVDDFIKNGNLFVLYGPTWYLITPNTSCDVGFTNYTIEGDLWRTCYIDNDGDGVEDIYKVIIPHFSTIQLRATGETATYSVSGGGGGGGGGGISGFIIYSPDTETYYNKTQTEEMIKKSIEEGKPVFTLKIRLDRKSKVSVYLVDNDTLMFSGNTSFVSLMLPNGKYKVVVEKDGIKKEIIVELNQPKTLDIRLDELNQETVHQTQTDVSFKIGRVLIVIILILGVIVFFRYK